MESYYKKYEPIFGGWYITEKIGSGAYGQVYIIERHEMGVVYRSALKAMTIPQDKNEIKSIMSDGINNAEVTEYYKNLVQNIVNEFIVMSKLKGNSHIVSYEDHILMEHDEDIGWDILIRMELLTPLVEHTSKETMDEREVIKLGIDLCKALEFCRKYDVIHRDIKPENIFIAPSGDYKLGDFGISRTVEKTRLGLSRKGTYWYMAPEVYIGAAYGATVDIYSLGMVMYKLLNKNRMPFMPEFPVAITYDDREDAFSRRIQGEAIPEPQNGSEELKRIILKACAFQSEDRYSSAANMRKDLEKLFYKFDEDSSISGETEKFDAGQNCVGGGNTPPEQSPKTDLQAEGETERKKIYKRKYMAALAVALVLAVAGIIFAVIPKAPEDIKGLNAQETIYIGDTLSPEYVIEPERFADESIQFDPSDETVISVDKEGNITGTALGECRLTLSAGGYSEEVVIKVIAKVTGIFNVGSKIKLTEGERQTLKPKLSPDQFSDEPIIYTIKDSSIASINKSGTIVAKAPGVTTLTICAGGFSKNIKIVVSEYVAPASSYAPSQNISSSPSGGSSTGSGNSGSGSGGNTRKSSGGSDDGFFNSSDDEYF